MRFALLPGGTSNTLAVSLGMEDIFASIVALMAGRVRAIDMMKISTDGEGDAPATLHASETPTLHPDARSSSHYVRYNPMSFGWGLVGTHDIYQERRRPHLSPHWFTTLTASSVCR